MEKEDKDLLLKDLSGRLPYGVKCKSQYVQDVIIGAELLIDINIFGRVNIGGHIKDICDIKPYLFPLSSMTEGQYEEFCRISNWDGDIEDIFYCDGYIGLDYLYDSADWFNKNHFDWRGLIPKGLAIDANNLNIY